MSHGPCHLKVAIPGWGWSRHPLLEGRGVTLHRFELQTVDPAEHGRAYTQDLALPPLPGALLTGTVGSGRVMEMGEPYGLSSSSPGPGLPTPLCFHFEPQIICLHQNLSELC